MCLEGKGAQISVIGCRIVCCLSADDDLCAYVTPEDRPGTWSISYSSSVLSTRDTRNNDGHVTKPNEI